MKIRLTCVALALELRVVAALAGDAKVGADGKAEWLDWLQKLKREEPGEYAKYRTAFTFVAQLDLAKLGYGTRPFDGVLDEKTQDALRAYERDRRLPVTGDPLSAETFQQLRADSAAYDYSPVWLPPLSVFADLWERGYVSASGTWVISGEKQGWPEQTSKIDCHRDLGTCTEATAIVSADGSRHLSVDIDTYEIERWDEQEVVTKPLQLACVRYVRRFNCVQKSVTGIRSTTANEDTCNWVERSEKYLVMTDGFKVHSELEQAQKNKWHELLDISPDLMNMLESGAKTNNR